MIYFKLFLVFFKIGVFGFGGGAAMLSMIQYEVVEQNAWLTEDEFIRMTAISQMTPGPIGINCATYTGYLATDTILGAFIATFALVSPAFIVIALMIKLYRKYKENLYVVSVMNTLRPTVAGLMIAACLLLINESSFGEKCADFKSWILFALTIVAVKWLKVSPIIIIILAAVIGIILYS